MTRLVTVHTNNCMHRIDLDHQPSSGDHAASCPTCGSNYPQLQQKYHRVNTKFNRGEYPDKGTNGQT